MPTAATTSTTTSIHDLPNEALHGVVDHLGHSDLHSMSLVDKRCGEMAQAALLQEHLDLGKRESDELEDMYYDLFAEASEIYGEDHPNLRDDDDDDGVKQVGQSSSSRKNQADAPAPPLRGKHVKLVSLQLLIELCDGLQQDDDDDDDRGVDDNGSDTPARNGSDLDSEFTARHRWVKKCLQALGSVDTLEIEVSLAGDVSTFRNQSPNKFWEEEVHPALRDLADLIKEKVKDVVLCVNSFEMEPAGEGEGDSAPSASTSKASRRVFSLDDQLASVLSELATDKCSALEFTGLEFKDAQSTPLLRALRSPNLKELTLKECWGDFSTWKPNSLTKLIVSWGADEHGNSMADLKVALRLLKYTNETIETLVLQNIRGQSYKDLMSAREGKKPMSLPRLSKLHIADCTLDRDSLLGVTLASISAPNLKTLQLECEDVLAYHLVHIPASFPKLSELRLSEGRVRSLRNAAMDAAAISSLGAGFRATVKACESANVKVRVDYNVMRCDHPTELSSELDRIMILSDHLDTLSLSLAPPSLFGVNLMDPFEIPNLSKLSICVTDYASSADFNADLSDDGQDDDGGEPAADEDDSEGQGHGGAPSSFRKASASAAPFEVPGQLLGNFLEPIRAANLKHLDLTLFVRNTVDWLTPLKDVIVNGQFPKLESVGGAVMAGPTMTEDQLDLYEDALRAICDKRKIDSSKLRFVSREEMLGRSGGSGFDDDDDDDDFSDEGHGYYNDEGEEISSNEGNLGTINEEDEEDAEDDREDAGHRSDDSGVGRDDVDAPARKHISSQSKGKGKATRTSIGGGGGGLGADLNNGSASKHGAVASHGRSRAASTSSYGSWTTDQE